MPDRHECAEDRFTPHRAANITRFSYDCYNFKDSAYKAKFPPADFIFVAATVGPGRTMKNPLDSLWGTVISGMLLTAILYFVVKSILT